MKHFLLFCMMAAVLSAYAQNKRTMVVNKLRAVEQKDVNTPVTSNTSVKEVNTDKAIENDERVSVQLVSCEPGVTKDKKINIEPGVGDGYPLLPGVVTTSSWSDNWFMNLQFGGSTFIGSPIGCGDMFDRPSFNFNDSFGKWVTPAVGMRIAYQGFRLKIAQWHHRITMRLIWIYYIM